MGSELGSEHLLVLAAIFVALIIFGFCFRACCQNTSSDSEEDIESGIQTQSTTRSRKRQKSPKRSRSSSARNAHKRTKIDLHGDDKSTACTRVKELYSECVRMGVPEFEVITGQGIHSPRGPVIKPAIENLASQLGWDCEEHPTNAGRLVIDVCL